MDQFPQMLYKADGPLQIHDGWFSTLTVGDADELAAALADGWAGTTPGALQVKADAIEATRAATEQSLEAETRAALADDTAPPTRAELEQMATSLNISFSSRTSDKKLRALIDAATAPDAG